MIHQALGRGVQEHTKSKQPEATIKLINFIEQLIKPLLPKQMIIRPKLEKIIRDAVDLANVMCAEQALFHCYMIDSGTEFIETSMELSDENQSGRVFLCTFPTFAKRYFEDGKDARAYILKANVELESVLGDINSQPMGGDGTCQ